MKSLPFALASFHSFKLSATTIVRLLLFLTLFVSGLAKLISPVHGETLISQLVPGVLFPFVQVALPICELLLSFMFLHPSLSIAASSISVLAFLGSTVVGIVFLDVPTECGCFGTLFESHLVLCNINSFIM